MKYLLIALLAIGACVVQAQPAKADGFGAFVGGLVVGQVVSGIQERAALRRLERVERIQALRDARAIRAAQIRAIRRDQIRAQRLKDEAFLRAVERDRQIRRLKDLRRAQEIRAIRNFERAQLERRIRQELRLRGSLR